MAVAEASPRRAWRSWWSCLPQSWIKMSPIEGGRERERDADDTAAYPRRRWEDSGPPPPAPRIQVPLGLVVTIVIYLLGQLIGSIWWAATLQSNQNHEIADRAKEEARLWQEVGTCRLEVQQLRVEVARSSPRIQVNRRSRDEEE